MPYARLLCVVASLGLAGGASTALAQKSPARAPAAAFRTTALTVAAGSFDSHHTVADSSRAFAYDASVRQLRLAGNGSSLVLSYGTTDSAGVDTRLIDVAARLGGRTYIVRSLAGLPVAAFVPIGLDLGYRNQTEKGAADEEMFHLGSVGLSAGGGVAARLPEAIPVVGGRLVGAATLRFGAGAFSEADPSLDGFGLQRSRELAFDVRAEGLLGDRLGVAAGLLFRTMHGRNGIPTGVSDAVDLVTDARSLFPQRASSTGFHIGLTF